MVCPDTPIGQPQPEIQQLTHCNVFTISDRQKEDNSKSLQHFNLSNSILNLYWLLNER